MASDMDVCTNYPDFAVICSFIENFSEKLKLNLPNIEELQLLLENTENVNPNLAQLVAQLLRKINKSVKYDKWERGLQRFAHTYSHQDGWELERFGFKKAKLEVKIRVIKNLLEAQFDGYKSFKEKVNLVSAKELRLQPCGRDKYGVSYWCQLDEFANLRIYKDDQDEETWKLVARSREELVELIDELEKKYPSSIGRETSVDESESGITTPMVLSEAPTPVDSTAPTPVTSGRTSPVLDTGQVKDKLNESESVVQPTKLSTDVGSKKEKVEKKRKQSKEEESSENISSSDASLANNKDIPVIDDSEKPKEVNSVKNAEEKLESKPDLGIKAKGNEIQPTESHRSIDLRSNIKKTESPEFKKKASNLDAIINMSVSKSIGEKLGGKLEAKVAAIKELPPPSVRKEKPLTNKENMVKKDSDHLKSNNEKDKALQETAYKEVSVKQLPAKIPKEPDKSVRVDEEKRKLDEQGEFEPINKKSKLDTLNESQNTSQNIIGEKSLESSVKLVPISKRPVSVEESKLNKKSEKKIQETTQQEDTKIMQQYQPSEQINPVNMNKKESQEGKQESLQSVSRKMVKDSLTNSEDKTCKESKVSEIKNKEFKPPLSKDILKEDETESKENKNGNEYVKKLPEISSEEELKKRTSSISSSVKTENEPNVKENLSKDSSKDKIPSISEKLKQTSLSQVTKDSSEKLNSEFIKPEKQKKLPKDEIKSEEIAVKNALKVDKSDNLSKQNLENKESLDVSSTANPSVPEISSSDLVLKKEKSIGSVKSIPLKEVPLDYSLSKTISKESPKEQSIEIKENKTLNKIKSSEENLSLKEGKVFKPSQVSETGKAADYSKKTLNEAKNENKNLVSKKNDENNMGKVEESIKNIKTIENPQELKDKNVTSKASNLQMEHTQKFSKENTLSNISSENLSKKEESLVASSSLKEKTSSFKDNRTEKSSKTSLHGELNYISPVPHKNTSAEQKISNSSNSKEEIGTEVKNVECSLKKASSDTETLKENVENKPISPSKFSPKENIKDKPTLANLTLFKENKSEFTEEPVPLNKNSSEVLLSSVESVGDSGSTKTLTENKISTRLNDKLEASLTEDKISTKLNDKLEASLTEDKISTKLNDKLEASLTEDKISTKLNDKLEASLTEDKISTKLNDKLEASLNKSESNLSESTKNPSASTPADKFLIKEDKLPVKKQGFEDSKPLKEMKVENEKKYVLESKDNTVDKDVSKEILSPVKSAGNVESLSLSKDNHSKESAHSKPLLASKDIVKKDVNKPLSNVSEEKQDDVVSFESNKQPCELSDEKCLSSSDISKSKVNYLTDNKPQTDIKGQSISTSEKPSSKDTSCFLTEKNQSVSEGKPTSNIKEIENKSSNIKEGKVNSSEESDNMEKLSSKMSNSEVNNDSQKSSTQEDMKLDSDHTSTSKTGTVSSLHEDKMSESHTQEKVVPESALNSKDSLDLKEDNKEPDVGEAIEEPVLIVKGDGEGKLCDAGNMGEGESCEEENNLSSNSGIKYFSFRDSSCINDNISNNNNTCSYSSITHLQNDVPHYCTTCISDDGATRFSKEYIPWWENFELFENNSLHCEDAEDVVVEEVRYFCGDGEGAECEAGNSGDEEVSCKESSKVKNSSQSSLKKTKTSEENEDVPEGEMNGLKNEEEKPFCDKERGTNVSDIKHVPDSVSSETHNNEQKPKDTMEVNGKVEDSDKKERVIVAPTKKGRGRPKKGTWTKITPTPEKKKEKPEEDFEKEKEMEIEEDDEKLKGRKSRSDTSRNIADTPRLRSARIAKIREREETERRELEAQRLKQIAEENKVRELKKKARTERRYIREIKKNKKEKKKEKEKKRKKRKKRAKKKKVTSSDPWAHSSTSSSSSSEDDDLDMEEDNEDLFKSDHEFSPESDIGEEDAMPIKRARTAKKAVPETKPKKEKKEKKAEEEIEEEEEEEEEEEMEEETKEEDDTSCMKCNHQDHPETILLCDNCDQGWHLSCLRPPLLSVPEGDWICPTCEHSRLVDKLKSILVDYDNFKKRAENEEMRRQRLAYISVSLDNVIPDKKRKKKHRRDEDGEGGSDDGSDDSDDDDDDDDDNDDDDSESGSDDSSSSGSSSSYDSDSSGPLYTLRARLSRTPKEQMENFDELINEAIRDEMEAAMVVKKGVGRGKDIANIVEGEVEDDYGLEEEQEPEEEEEEELPEIKPSKPPEQLIEEDAAREAAEELNKKTCKEEGKNEKEKKEKEEDEEETEKDTEVKTEEEKNEKEDEKEETGKKINQKKRKKNSGIEDNDEDEVMSEEAEEEESDSEVERRPRRVNRRRTTAPKKKRRLTDLDVEEDEDDSDEDFLGTSEEEDEEEVSDALVSSSFETESDSDYSDYGGKRGKGNKIIPPLRRSARNRRNTSIDDYDSDLEKRISKKSKKKKTRKAYDSSDDEDELSSDSDTYFRKKKARTRKKSQKTKGKKGKGRKGSKKGGNKKGPKKKAKDDDDDEEPPKPKRRVKYAKPPKPKEEEEEEGSRRRVTRGRQINYYDSLLMSDDEEEEEIKPKSRGKVMKGERVPSESSEYEESDDERKKRRGVSGGLGRGKVMKSEEEDEEEYNRKKKKLDVEENIEESKKKEEVDDTPKSTESVMTNVKSLPLQNQTSVAPTSKLQTDQTDGGPTVLTKNILPQDKNIETPQVKQPQTQLPQVKQTQQPQAQQLQSQQLQAQQPQAQQPQAQQPQAQQPQAQQPQAQQPQVQHPREQQQQSISHTPIIPQSSQLQQIISKNPVSSATVVPQKVTSPRLPTDITSRLPLTVTRLNTPTSGGTASIRPSFNPRIGTPNGARSTLPPVSSSISVIGGPSSSISITPVSFGNPKPPTLGSRGAPPASISVHSVSSASALKTASEKPVEVPPAITISTKRGTAISSGAGAGNNAGGGSSPGPLPPVGKWSPHVIGSSNSGSATPPRPGATPVNSSPPPPYRSSPIPVTVSSASTPLSTVAHRGTPPNLPPQTTSTTPYSPYQSPEHFGSHPTFPSGFHPGSSHSPGPHGNQPRHSLHSSHPVYGTPVTHPNYHQGLSPHHTSVLRGPPHDLYRHSSPSSVGSPSHAAAHARSVLLKQAYAGLEPLPYSGSPQGTPIDATRHNSPGPPISETKEDQQQQQLPPTKRLVEGGEFSSGLMSYFSSQRDENVD